MSVEDEESEFRDALETGEFENDWDDFDNLPDRRITELHPAMLGRVITLTNDLRRRYASRELTTRWLVSEAVRTAERQRLLHSTGESPFQGWQSAHQYGFAVDFEAYDEDGARIKNPSAEQWAELHKLAHIHGLEAPFKSHRGHLQLPEWPRLRRILFPTWCSAPAVKNTHAKQ